MTAETGLPYGEDRGRFEREHEGWSVARGLEGYGWGARRWDGGRTRGPVVPARTLDELHEVLAAEDA